MEEKPIGSEGTVLLVDDEQLIIDVGTAILERLGYTVLVAQSGQEAICMIQDKSVEVDLIILDLIMPEMDGAKTFESIIEIAPEIPVLLSSGYSMNEQTDALLQKGLKGFLQKPFSVVELSEKVSALLKK